MTPSRVLATKRLDLIPLSVADQPLIDTLYTDAQVVSGFGMAPLSREELDAKLQQALGPWAIEGFGSFRVVLRDTGEAVGVGGIRPTEELGVGEIGYGFMPASWGQGFASESTQAWVRWGFEDLGLRAVVATGVIREASVRALLKAGFIVTKSADDMQDLRLEPKE
jgi:RimJ/RimL family protein N-acetyltransferase